VRSLDDKLVRELERECTLILLSPHPYPGCPGCAAIYQAALSQSKRTTNTRDRYLDFIGCCAWTLAAFPPSAEYKVHGYLHQVHLDGCCSLALSHTRSVCRLDSVFFLPPPSIHYPEAFIPIFLETTPFGLDPVATPACMPLPYLCMCGPAFVRLKLLSFTKPDCIAASRHLRYGRSLPPLVAVPRIPSCVYPLAL
jgi:hypothetical protein